MIIEIDNKTRIRGTESCYQLERPRNRKGQIKWEPYEFYSKFGYAGCQKLSELILDRSKVTDAGLAQFKDWKELKSLTLSFTGVGDGGLAHLKNYPSLTFFSLKDARKLPMLASHIWKNARSWS